MSKILDVNELCDAAHDVPGSEELINHIEAAVKRLARKACPARDRLSLVQASGAVSDRNCPDLPFAVGVSRVAVARHYMIQAGPAEHQGSALAGLCVPFWPSFAGQHCPACIAYLPTNVRPGRATPPPASKAFSSSSLGHVPCTLT